MPRSLAVESISIREFRNLSRVDLELGPRFNVFSGGNGQGKTNLMEAVYVLATSRSFRTSSIAQLIMEGGHAAGIHGRMCEDGDRRDHGIVLRSGSRSAKIDGKRPSTLASYALQTPAVVFHPGGLALSAGGGSERRKLLDRIALYSLPASLGDVEAYARAMRARQRVLETRGEAARDLDGWEELAVVHGMAVGESRRAAAELLLPAAQQAFLRIGPPGLELGMRYERGSPSTAEAFRAQLVSSRTRDRARRSASVGPHRDELVLELAGRSVRHLASQGQHRTVVLSLKLAEIEVVAAARGVRPLLLLDDVSSELDRERTSALFSALRSAVGQVLLTTTRPELIETGERSGGDERWDFSVDSGHIVTA